MNVLLIITGMIFLICVIVGMTRGFIKIVASLVATLIIIALVMFLSPYVSKGILKMTPLETVVQKKCADMLTENKLGEAEIPREVQISAIENADVPEIFREMLLENNNSEIYEALGVVTFGEYIGAYLAKVIADFAGFILTMIVVTIVVRSVIYTLGLIGDLPVIGGLNRIAGGVLGVGIGVIIVWVLFIGITLIYSTAVGKICFENIADSRLLTYLYENNILMDYVTKFRA